MEKKSKIFIITISCIVALVLGVAITLACVLVPLLSEKKQTALGKVTYSISGSEIVTKVYASKDQMMLQDLTTNAQSFEGKTFEEITALLGDPVQEFETHTASSLDNATFEDKDIKIDYANVGYTYYIVTNIKNVNTENRKIDANSQYVGENIESLNSFSYNTASQENIEVGMSRNIVMALSLKDKNAEVKDVNFTYNINVIPQELPVPTLNLLDYYKNTKVNKVSDFEEQALTQNIVPDENHKSILNAEGIVDGRLYIYNYKVSDMADNIQSIDISASSTQGNFNGLNSLLVRGNYASYDELAGAMNSSELESESPSESDASFTLNLTKNAGKNSIDYCFLVLSETDVETEFNVSTNLNVEEGSTFEKNSAILNTVDIDDGFDAKVQQRFNETKITYNFTTKDEDIIYTDSTEDSETKETTYTYYYAYNYSITNAKTFSNVAIRVKDKTNPCEMIGLISGNYENISGLMMAFENAGLKKTYMSATTMLSLNLVNAKMQEEISFTLLLMSSTKITDTLAIEINANRSDAKPLEERLGYDYRYDLGVEEDGEQKTIYARISAGDKKSNIFDEYTIDGTLNYSVSIKDDISNVKLDLTDEQSIKNTMYAIYASPVLFAQAYYLISFYQSAEFIPIPKANDSYLISTENGVVEVTQDNWLQCVPNLNLSEMSEDMIAEIKTHCIEVVDGQCVVPLCNDYIVQETSSGSTDFISYYIIVYLFGLSEFGAEFENAGYAYSEAGMSQGIISIYANIIYNYFADGGVETEGLTAININKNSSLEEVFVNLLNYYLTADNFNTKDLLGEDAQIVTREYRSIYLVPGNTYTYNINGIVFDKEYSANVLNVNVDVNKFKINVWNAKTIVSNNSSAYVDNNALINSTTKEMIRYAVDNEATEYSVPQGIKLVGKYALYNCKNLKALTINVDGLDKFDETSLKNTKVDKLYASSSYLSNRSFDMMLKNSDILEVEGIGKEGTTWNDINQFVVISSKPITVKYTNNISGLVFELGQNGYIVSGASDKTISKVYIPETYNGQNVVGIKESAFQDFANLTDIILPTTIKTIGDNAFKGCINLKMLTLDNITLEYFGVNNILPTMVVTSNVDATLNKIMASNENNISVDLDFGVGRSRNTDQWDQSNMNESGEQKVEYRLTIGEATYEFVYNYDNTLTYTREIVFNQGVSDVSASLYAKIDALPLIGLGESNHTVGIDHIQEQIALQRTSDNTKLFGTATDETYYNHSEVPAIVEYSTTDASKVKSGDSLKLVIKFEIMENVQCFTGETLVTLADGSTKQIKDVTYDDLLMVYDFDRGEFSASYPIWIAKVGEYNHYYKMSFSDGSYVNIVLSHRLFTLTDMDFEKSIDATYSNIGKEFVKQIIDENGKPKFVSVTCTNIERIDETVKYYNMVTSQSLNFFSNGFLGATGIANLYHFEKDANGNIVHNQTELARCKAGTTDWETGTQFAYDKYDENKITEEVYVAYRLSEIRNMADCWINDPSSPYYAIAQKYGRDVVYNKAIQVVNEYFKDGYIESLRSTDEKFKITLSDRTLDKKVNYKDIFTLPEANNSENFVGWYNTYDGKIYQAGESAEIHMNTHFIARYSK